MRLGLPFTFVAALVTGCQTTQLVCDANCRQAEEAKRIATATEERTAVYGILQMRRNPNGRLDDDAAKLAVTMYLAANPVDRAHLDQVLHQNGLGYIAQQALQERENQAAAAYAAGLGKAVVPFQQAAAKQDVQAAFRTAQELLDAYHIAPDAEKIRARDQLRKSATRLGITADEQALYGMAFQFLDHPQVTYCLTQHSDGRFAGIRRESTPRTGAHAAALAC